MNSINLKNRISSELSKIDDSLNGMYLAAFECLDNISSIEKYVLAAHCLRELIEKLPQKLIENNNKSSYKMKDEVIQLKIYWDNLYYKLGSNNISNLSELFRKETTEYLKRSKVFFDKFQNYKPPKNQQRIKIFNTLGEQDQKPPNAIENNWLDIWKECDEYFQKNITPWS
jgi:hypothetical protein